jgi:hypothetical protein
MQKWEISSFVTNQVGEMWKMHVENIWNNKFETGKSDWDELKKMASEGWELVSVTPIANVNGNTTQLLFIFKRPIENPLPLIGGK